MSDRHIVEKKFNDLAIRRLQERNLVAEWDALSEDEKPHLSTIFFCRIHLVIGMAA